MPSPRIPRYSARPLPARRYLPGRGPHPSRGDAAVPSASRDAADRLRSGEWRTCEDWLHAVDLFNHGYWWEAHELLEDVWREAGRATPLGLLLQGLILVAAALLQQERGAPAGARRLAERATAALARTHGADAGFDARTLVAALQTRLDDASRPPPRIALRDPPGA